jgi:hypothetical protein
MFHNGARVSERLDSIEAMHTRTEAMTTEIRNLLKHLDVSSCEALPGIKPAKITLSERRKLARDSASTPAEIFSEAGNRKRLWSYQKKRISCQAGDTLAFSLKKDQQSSFSNDCEGGSDPKACGISVVPASNDETMTLMSSARICSNSVGQQQYRSEHNPVQCQAKAPANVNAKTAGVEMQALETVAAAPGIAMYVQGLPSGRMDMPGNSANLSHHETDFASISRDQIKEDNYAAEETGHAKTPINPTFHAMNAGKRPTPASGNSSADAHFDSRTPWSTPGFRLTEHIGSEQVPGPPANQAVLPLMLLDQAHLRSKQEQQEKQQQQIMKDAKPSQHGGVVPQQLLYC